MPDRAPMDHLAAPPAAEAQLLEAARRAQRQAPALNIGRVALILHLSAMRPPAPRPHHRRIARAILQDAAQRHDGQVFALRNGDIAVLCRESALHETRSSQGGRERREAAAEDQSARASHDPSQSPSPAPAPPLVAALRRLLRIDVVDPARLVSIWQLGRDHARLMDYAAARTRERFADAPSDDEPPTPPGVVDEISALVAAAEIHDLVQRQTAVALLAAEDRAPGLAPTDAPAALRPVYREVTFSIAALEARISPGGRIGSDPFLFRHLAGQLDRRMLDLVADQLGGGGPLDLAIAARGAPPLHLNLTLGAVLSSSFVAFAAACRDAGATAGIEISLIEACADTRAFAAARSAIQHAGMALVLDGVTHLAMLLAAPWLLDPDQLKLDWSPRLADLGPDDQRDMAAAISATGAHRIVLQRAETEAAVRWGMAQGIRRFQGRHIDAMLGASRIMGCGLSAGCALRQCIERATALGPAARAGCGNPELLDAATPPRARRPVETREPRRLRHADEAAAAGP